MEPTHRTAVASGLASGLLALTLGASSASAAVITFGGLSGATGDPLHTYSEAGFTVIPTLGDWKEFHTFGNPVPSVNVADLGPNAPFGQLQVTANGGLFTLNSLDLQVFYAGAGHEIRGSRAGTVLFSVADNVAAGSSLQTLTGGGSFAIDTLTIDIASSGPGAFWVDNINVTAVPEPTAHLLLLAGLGLLATIRRQASGQ